MGDDPYLIPGTTTLRNKLGITDPDLLSEAEFRISWGRGHSLFNGVKVVNQTMAGWRQTHLHLFADVYDWAGKYRTVYLSRPYDGGTSQFSRVEDIDRDGGAVLKGPQAAMRRFAQNDAAFAAYHLANAYVDLNKVHPFREGNGRSQRVFFSLICRPYKIQIDWSAIPSEDHYKAAIASHRGDPSLMREQFAAMTTKIDGVPAMRLPR